MTHSGQTDLSTFNNRWYKPGRNLLIIILWYCMQGCFFGSWIPGSGWRRFLLRLFGAKVGKGVVIKPRVIVKYPWNLKVGDYSWIGEKVWLDSLAEINIGSHCCLSQGAVIICGNHNYKKPGFDLILGNVTMENGTWLGAGSMLLPGAVMQSQSILTAGSTSSGTLDAYGIYTGITAVKIRERIFES